MLRLLTLFILGLTVINGTSPIPKLEGSLPRQPQKFKLSAEDDIQYRLSGDVVPEHYDLTIRLEEDAFTNKKFLGTVTISLDVINETPTIDLNCKDITISELKLTKDGESITVTHNDCDDESEILTVTAGDNLTTDAAYVLTITYVGVLSSTSMNGFYMSSYLNGETTEYLATTQFEPTHARQAFPSFDEPEIKATFQVTIELLDASYTGYNAMSNTDSATDTVDTETGYRTIVFNTTPKMSTYLIAFIVSKFECKEGKSVDTIKTRACARSGATSDITVALDTAPEVLTKMADYTGYKYGDSKIGKLAQVAIPDFAAGAMENWGLVTYREADLLWNEKESSANYKQKIATVVAHELSHQWFGDLVTLGWWENVFLNEGFATYFEYQIADEIYPEWNLAKQFVVQEVQTALLADSYSTSLPLSFNVEAPTDISNRFDDISYNKGGSILRMIQHFLGLDNFKKGLTDYISAKQFSNSEPLDLWVALTKYFKDKNMSKDLPVVINNWINEAGYPVLTVKSDGPNVTISQERFLISGTDTATTKWYVPISYTLSTDEDVGDDTTTKAWLTADKDLVLTDVLSEAEWIILNNQQAGFYRVDYDDALWAKIFDALSKEDFSKINELNRAQITDDLLNFARANKKTYTKVLQSLQFLTNETSYYTWYAAFNGFTYLLNKIGNEKVQTAFQTYLKNLIEGVYKSTSFDENPDDQVEILTQTLALSWACKLGDKECLTSVTKQFASYRDDDTTPDPNLKSVVYCNGLRNSDNIKQDFDFLWGKLEKSQISTETVTILQSLGCAKDADILKTYLLNTIADDSVVRVQDGTYPFASVYSNNPEGVDVVLDFVIANYDKITNHFGSSSLANSVLSAVADRITTQAQIDKLTKFSTDTNNVAASAIETATNNLKVTTALEKQLTEFFNLSDDDDSGNDDDGDSDDNSAAYTYQMNLAFLAILYIFVNFIN